MPTFSPSVPPIKNVKTLASSSEARAVISKYLTVLDGQIRILKKEFSIYFSTPFCVHTQRTIPLAYQDKLKAELDLLKSQNLIAPITKTTT